MVEKSYIYGPIFLILLFIICLIIVLGFNAVISIIKGKFNPPPVAPTPTQTVKKPRRAKTIRTIEINPDEINRISFRKP